MKIEFINDELHAEENLTRIIKATTDKDLVSFQHFLAFVTASGAVKVTNPITPSADDNSIFYYELTADLIPSRGYLSVQLIASDGASGNPKVIKSDVFAKYIKPSIHIPEEAETPDGQYISVFTLTQRIDALEDDIGQAIKEYFNNNPITALNVSFDNKDTDITSNNVQGALIELAERGGTSIPSYTLYGYKSLTDAQKAHNAEIVELITSDKSNAFICTMPTDDFELSLNSLWYYDLPEFEYFDTTTNTHYKYIANKDGTVTIEENKNADPSAVQSSTAPTTSTSGAFVGQLCIVGNGKSVYVYKGLISNVHLWMQIPTMNDIPTKVSQLENDSGFLTKHQSLDGYAKEEYVTEAISTALGSVETALEAITTGGGVE